MAAVLFVHGTGVRKAAYLTTFAILSDAFDHFDIGYDLEPCLWGDDLGAAKPHLSLPEAPDFDAEEPSRYSEEEDLARWDLLYRDPLFELRLLKQRPLADGPIPPTAPRPDRELWERIQAYDYKNSPRMSALLGRWRLEADWAPAWSRVIVDDPAGVVLGSSPTEIGEPGQAIARALVAAMLQNVMENDRPLPDARHRDQIVEALVEEWGANVAGVGTFLMQFFGDAAATAATPILRWKRREWSTAASPAAGDILLYQARGQQIRKYIRRCAENLKTEVILMAHSLGGVACVDLLAMGCLPCVKKLITAGSQAPLFHELGALRGLKPKTPQLPDHFPPWLNFYDPYDFLSYCASRVFPGPAVRDVRVESGQPFPQSHSAYWANPDTWHEIKAFLK